MVSMNYIRGYTYICKTCRANAAYIDKEIRKEEDFDKKEKKYENALKRMAKMIPRREAPQYTSACERVHKKLHENGWFDSTEEIMVAIELIKNGLKIKHHYRVGGRFEADYVIPSMKVVLEVDGKVFHNGRKEKEVLRDEFIKNTLGEEWEIVRISDDLINQNIRKLVSAITAVVEKRKKLRAENGGTLPEWYADGKIV